MSPPKWVYNYYFSYQGLEILLREATTRFELFDHHYNPHGKEGFQSLKLVAPDLHLIFT